MFKKKIAYFIAYISFSYFLCNAARQPAAKRIAVPRALSRIDDIKTYYIFKLTDGLKNSEKSKALALIRQFNKRSSKDYEKCPWPNCNFESHSNNIPNHIDITHLKRTLIYFDGAIKSVKNKKNKWNFTVIYFIKKEFAEKNQLIHKFFEEIESEFFNTKHENNTENQDLVTAALEEFDQRNLEELISGK